jgi:transcriptional regulator GlxA family with amidase domain
MAHRITLLALSHCLASNIMGAIDLFHTANFLAKRGKAKDGPLFEWQVLSLDGRPVKSSSGCLLPVDGSLKDRPPGKVVMIPAFGSPIYEKLIEEMAKCGLLVKWLKDQHRKGATLTATCTGSFLLAECGLLDGRPATTSWWLAPLFEKRYPKVLLESDSMLTVSDRIICSGTGMSHLDLALYLIEKYASRELARSCAKFAVVDLARRSQAPYTVLNYLRTNDPVVWKAEKWMRIHLKETMTIEDIARHAAVSTRTLMRHFKEATGDSPQAFLQKMRVENGKALLENTRLRMGEILDRVGYNDESAFRRLFKKHTGLSPRDYRRRFGIEAGSGSRRAEPLNFASKLIPMRKEG